MGQARLLDWQRRLLNVLTKPWIGLTTLALITLLLYLPSLSNWGAVDDLIHLEAALFHEAPTSTFFRPLERWVNELNVDWLGYDDLRFALGVNLAGLLVTVGATYVLGRTLCPDARLASLFAAAIVGLSSLSVTTAAQIDTISQQFATIFPLLFFLALLQATRRSSRILFLAAFSFAVLALLSKETSLGLLGAGPLAAYLVTPSLVDRTARQKVLGMLANYLVLAALIAVYLGLRVALGYIFSGESGQYALTLSLPRLAKNAALYFSGLVYVGGSTLDIFPGLKPERMLVSSLFSVLLLGVSCLGIVHLVFSRAKVTRVLLALFLLMLAGSVPVAITEQVSELYVYSSLPYFALFVGIGFVWGCRRLAASLGSPKVFGLTAVVCCGLFAWLTVGSHGKLEALGEGSGRSKLYFAQSQAFIGRAPSRDINLCWANMASSRAASYSVFVFSPQLLASRALSFAINLHQRQDSNSRIAVLGAAPDARNCDYAMTIDNAGLQFKPLSSPANL